MLRRRAEPRRAAALAHRASRRGVAPEKMHPVLAYGGFPLSAQQVVEGVSSEVGGLTGAVDHQAAHPHSRRCRSNDLGLTIRDYEGPMSTLCAGCGHDSVTAAIVHAFWELATPPHMIAKLSGIGCSSKTPTYFVRGAHGFNSAHGRMAPIATGAIAANRDLTYIGISGDGDSLSIGLGHLMHGIRRNVKHGLHHREQRRLRPHQGPDVGVGGHRLDNRRRARPTISRRSTRSSSAFSSAPRSSRAASPGDKEQLVPILKAAIAHNGFALIDVISPCVTFNDHEGSTKSYKFMREHEVQEVETDFVPPRREIRATIPRRRARSTSPCTTAAWCASAPSPRATTRTTA